VLILQAKPKRNIPTKKIPKIITNFSLNLIFTFNYLLILLVSQLAFLNNLSSSKRDETNCTPTGRLSFPWSNGKLIDGIPQYVQTVQNIGSPVDFKPFGASPVEAGVKIAS
jgi:hypothetical protein